MGNVKGSKKKQKECEEEKASINGDIHGKAYGQRQMKLQESDTGKESGGYWWI